MKWTAIIIISAWIIEIGWLMYQLIKYITHDED